MHIAALDQHVGTDVNVDGVGRWCTALRVAGPHVLRRCKDIAVQVTHMVTLVDMVGPEGRIDQTDILNGDILRVGDVGQSRALGVLVRTLGVPLAANPELLPIGKSVAVDGAVAGDGKPVQSVGIHQRTEVSASLTLDTRLGIREVDDAVRALQLADDMQMRALPEEQGSRQVGAFGNDYHAAALLRTAVNDGLNALRLHDGGVLDHAIVRNDILTPQRLDVDFRGILEPCVHRGAVRPQLLLADGRLLFLLFR